MTTFYEVLGVTSTANTAAIRTSYRRLIRVHHPDVAGVIGVPASQQLNEALRVLTDPVLRQEYDQEIEPAVAYQYQPPTAPTAPPAAVPVDRLPSARTRRRLLLSGLALMGAWLVMVLFRPLNDSVVGFPLIFGIFAFIVSTKHALVGYPFAAGWLFNLVTVALTALYWTPFVGAVMGGVGFWSLTAGALYAAGSLLIAGRRIPLSL